MCALAANSPAASGARCRSGAASAAGAQSVARYTAVHAYTPKATSRPGWREHYPVFPLVLAVLTGKPRPPLERRRDVVLDLCTANPELVQARAVQVRVALLADLVEDGPFVVVFRTPRDPDRPVDWLGTAGEGRR